MKVLNATLSIFYRPDFDERARVLFAPQKNSGAGVLQRDKGNSTFCSTANPVGKEEFEISPEWRGLAR